MTFRIEDRGEEYKEEKHWKGPLLSEGAVGGSSGGGCPTDKDPPPADPTAPGRDSP